MKTGITLAFFQALIGLALIAAPIGLASAQRKPVPLQSNNIDSSGPSAQTVVQMLTPHPGVDFKPFTNQMLSAIRTQWSKKMPSAASLGAQARVIVRFAIQRDGTLLSQGVTIEGHSGRTDLDSAALQAVQAAAPYPGFPDSFIGSSMEFRVVFFYNTPAAAWATVIPAPTPQITGTWVGTAAFRATPTPRPVTFELKMQEKKIVGAFCMISCDAGNWKGDIQNGEIEGDDISFSVETGAADLAKMNFHATVLRDTMQFVISGKTPDCTVSDCEVAQGSATRSK